LEIGGKNWPSELRKGEKEGEIAAIPFKNAKTA